MSDWCPENDGAYRMELAAMQQDKKDARIEALTTENAILRTEKHADAEAIGSLRDKLARAVEAAYREGHGAGRIGRNYLDEDDDWMKSATLAAIKEGGE